MIQLHYVLSSQTIFHAGGVETHRGYEDFYLMIVLYVETHMDEDRTATRTSFTGDLHECFLVYDVQSLHPLQSQTAPWQRYARRRDEQDGDEEDRLERNTWRGLISWCLKPRNDRPPTKQQLRNVSYVDDTLAETANSLARLSSREAALCWSETSVKFVLYS